MLSAEALAPLETLVNSPEKIARKAIISVGEVAFYIATATSPLAFPSFTAPILLAALKNKDDPTRHYAIRAIANVLTRPKYAEIFDLEKVEQAVIVWH